MSRRSRTAAAVFITTIAIGCGLSVGGLVGSDRPPIAATGRTFVDGSAASLLENRFESEHPLRTAAIALNAGARLVLFGEAAGDAVVGRGGWLFTLEEFERRPDDADRAARRVAEIAEVRRRLLELDVEVAVVLVPSKARIYADRVPDRWRALADHPRYELALQSLRERGVLAVDLRDALRAGNVPTYFARDTHWTPTGARRAARALAAAVARRTHGLIGRERYEIAAREPFVVEGDLMGFVPVGEVLRRRLGLVPEPAIAFRAAPAGTDDAGPGLFDELTIPVALVGTSYSRDPRWAFDDALRLELGLDVLNVASAGEGPFEPMREYLQGDTISDVRPDLVVWEIPERYLTLP